MSSKLLGEIKQSKPFGSLEEEVMLNLQRTASVLSHAQEQRLRPFGLSPTQYNVLRILRGAGAAGLCQAEIGARLVAQVPDVPRILDRMEKAGWVRRERGSLDRRIVQASLTDCGCKLVNGLDEMMEQSLLGVFHGMSPEDLMQLSALLERARS